MEVDWLNRFNAAKNYALYYGDGRDNELSSFDVAIVEPGGQSPESVRRMQDAGALVLGYLSVSEIHPSMDEFKLLDYSDFLCINGRPLVNREYSNYLADLRSKRWNDILLYKSGHILHNLGYDGLFLDTIGNVESGDLAVSLKDSLLIAAADIVRKIRAIFPNHIIVQNCGLENLCFLTSGYLNGICWENPNFENPAGMLWAKNIVSNLVKLKDRYGLKIFILLEEKDKAGAGAPDAATERNYQMAREVAELNRFLLYRAPYRYVGGVNLPAEFDRDT
ncbi:MAG: hypothetical protein WC601_05705 [Desulfotomaculaceae bacterium]